MAVSAYALQAIIRENVYDSAVAVAKELYPHVAHLNAGTPHQPGKQGQVQIRCLMGILSNGGTFFTGSCYAKVAMAFILHAPSVTEGDHSVGVDRERMAKHVARRMFGAAGPPKTPERAEAPRVSEAPDEGWMDAFTNAGA